mmetsp:Transcript_28488/g.79666  ORF Transcript_28488/g.79666 Transcript_28488/m.79666 type:complete len:223 (-) Transcript_28488:383-1051(-)
MRSKRLRSGLEMPVFTDMDSLGSYSLPALGFVAASTLVRVFRVHTSPALATDNDCCSIASWIVVRSCGRIESNSSMAQTPPSARTRAPASNIHSPVAASRTAVTVSPALVLPVPVVRTERGTSLATNLRNCDLPVPGSPTRRRWTSPRTRSPPSPVRATPPRTMSMTASFTVRSPYICGQTLPTMMLRPRRGRVRYWAQKRSTSATRSSVTAVRWCWLVTRT